MKKAFLLAFIFCLPHIGHCQNWTEDRVEKPHSVYLEPITPLFNLLIVNYGYQLDQKNELVAGILLSKSETTPIEYYEYPGHVNTGGTVLGYRRYFAKGLHADYWLIPSLCSYHETGKEVVQGFTLYNEFRFGYRFNIQRLQAPLIINIQFPMGFSLFETNKPQSFKIQDEQDPLYYSFFPNIWIGLRF